MGKIWGKTHCGTKFLSICEPMIPDRQQQREDRHRIDISISKGIHWKEERVMGPKQVWNLLEQIPLEFDTWK